MTDGFDPRRLAGSLYHPILSSHADLRDQAQSILLAHCTLDHLLYCTSVASAPNLFRHALRLASQAAGRACDPGAALCRTAFAMTCLQDHVCMVWNADQLELVEGPACTSALMAGAVTLRSLGMVLAHQLAGARTHAMAAAHRGPIHGIAAALTACWLSLPCVPATAEDHVATQLLRTATYDVVGTAGEVCTFALGLLGSQGAGGDEDEDEMPSFCAMQQSLDSVAAGGGCTTSPEAAELLLSMAWQSLEQAAKLMAAVVNTVPLPIGSAYDVLSVDCLQACVDTLVSCLRTCRHRGVVEACSEALALIARRVLRSTHTPLYAIFFKTLGDCVSLISNASSASSITRRSAGLPAIILAVVANPTANVCLCL